MDKVDIEGNIIQRPNSVCIALLLMIFVLSANAKQNIYGTLLSHGGIKSISGWLGAITSYCIIVYLMFMVYRGRNWARYGLLAIVLFGVVSSIYNAILNHYIYANDNIIVMDIISLVVAIGAQAILFSAGSSKWFICNKLYRNSYSPTPGLIR